MTKVIGPARSRRRRSWLVSTAVGIAVLFAVFFVASSGAHLTGSSFGAGDGNLVCNDSNGANDWNTGCRPAGGINIGKDDPSGTGDNSFGQGTKEDDPAVTVVSGSIPPNKSDLTRFYEASESVNGNVFLYLAWERTNVLGTANMDFEINKNATPGFTGATVGKVTLTRTNGDLLVTYDFENGGSRPTIALLRWLKSGEKNPYDTSKDNAASDCYSASKLPCWGVRKVLDVSDPALAEAAINTDSVTDNLDGTGSANLACPGTTPTCPPFTFGEAAINLTAAGVTTANSCDFGNATTFLKSRSSTSFTSEVKDFVAPISTPISSCASITIIKRTLDGAGTRSGINQPFGYTTTGTGLSSFSLNDSAGSDNTSNTKTFSGLGPGSYSVTETLPVAGYALDDLTCSATGSGTSATPSNATASITLAFGGSVTCTYVNKQQLGAIRILKQSIKGTALQGATFAITKGGTAIANSPFTSDSNGVVCVGGLVFGDYAVTETGAPSGYNRDDTTAHTVTVNTTSSCANDGASIPATQKLTFTDTPLTDLTITVSSQAAGGTASHISCTSSNVDIGNSPQPATGFADPVTVSATGLQPGNYTCAVEIDP